MERLQDQLGSLLPWLLGQLSALSLEGIFFISFFSSLLVFLPAPYFIAVAWASNPVTGLDPTLIALYSSVGATLAKIVIFKASKAGRGLISRETRTRIRPFEILVARYGWIAAFIAALTPLPDDLIYVPLGFAGYSLWRFTLATWSGKLILTLVVSWGAYYSFGLVALLVGSTTSLEFLVASGLAFAATAFFILYLIMRIDWERLLSRWFPWVTEGRADGTSSPS